MGKNIMDDNKKPKKTPRIKHKKLIVLFTAILVVAAVFIIKAFSSKHYALAEETDSFEKERPTSGNPLDYSGKDNAAICNWVIRHTEEFKSVTTGTVTAKVAVINYNQDIHNTRIVTTDGCYIETISNSSLVKVYEEKFLQNDQVVVRKNHSDKYTTITNDVFLEKYGWHPKEFQAYILNEETIRDAKIEAFEGNYKLTLDLDPVKAVPKKQRETKTIGNANGYPGYKETVLTVILTSDWTPIEVDTYEVYDIGMPGIGDVTCKCNMVEKIEYGKFDIPDKDAFKAHINDAVGTLDEGEKDVIGYLQEIFGPLIQGKMNDFKITVDALDTNIEGDLNINLEASGVKVNADISDIYVSYQGDDIYIKLGDNKYKLNINDVKQYLDTSSLGNSEALDVNSLLAQVQNAQIIKNGNDVTIKINLDVMGIKASADINATLVNDVYSFKDIYAKVNVLGKDIILTMKPAEKHNYPVIDESYEDIKNMFFVIDEVKNLINKPLEITLNTTVKDIKISANAVYNNGLASGIITINDKYDINVYYNNETVYATFKNLYFKFNIKDIDKFTDQKLDLGDINIKLSDILDVIKTLNIDILGEKSFDLSIDLSKYTELLKDIKINVNKDDSLNLVIDKYNLVLSVKETLKEVATNPDVTYNDVADATWIIDLVTNLIKYEAYNFSIDLTYKDLIVDGNIYLDKDLNASAVLNLKYKDYEFNDIKAYLINKEVYISLYNIKLKASIDDIMSLIGEAPSFDIDSLLENLYVALDNEKVSFDCDLSSIISTLGNVNVVVDGNATVKLTADDLKANIKLTEATKQTITVDETEYIDLNSVKWLIDDIKDILEYEAFGFAISAEYKDLKVDGNIYLDKDLSASAVLNLKYKDYEFKDIKAYLIDKEIYINFYNIKLKSSFDDIMSLIGEAPSIDINSLLEGLYLASSDEKLSLDCNVSSIISALSNVNVVVNSDETIKLTADDLKANIKLTEATKQTITVDETEYIDLNSIKWLIDVIKDVVEYEAYNFNIDLTYKDLIVDGNVYLDKDLNASAVLNLTYKDYELNNIKVYLINKEIYISLYNIKLKASIDDIMSLIGEAPSFDIDSLLDGLYLASSDEKLSVDCNLSSIINALSNVNLIINSNASVKLTADDLKANIKLTEANKQTLTVDDAEYIDLNTIKWLVDDIKEVIEYKAFGFNVSAEYKDLKVNGNIYLNKDLEVEALLDVNYSGLEINGIKLAYKNKDVYVSFGKTSIMININDIDGIIEEINKEFDLNISKDDIKFEFDINKILNSITLTATSSKVVLSANLDSISDLLGDVTVTIEEGLKLNVATNDIKVSAVVLEKDYKEVILPVAKINKDEVYLLIEYAKQLKDIVEHWRYNIGFELHVNGYDVYARANIVTFKPEAGLSLYGKVILVKGDKKYYIEASIIDNVAFLNFSQTITNFNSSKPINSTTSQSIKFKINFNELIDIANYAIDALGIDNDTIKMAISYLGKIVNTNGDFDDLFDELSGKVKTIDLSMVTDIINLNELEILVDTDYLTINLGNNSENKLQTFTLFREGGVVKGLNVVDFEINNDILNGNFELLPDEDITSANYAGCLDLNGIGNLIKAGLNTYNNENKEISISGSLNMSVNLGLTSIDKDVDVEIKLSFKDSFKCYIYVHTPNLLADGDTTTNIYIQDSYIYMHRFVKKDGFLGIGASQKTETRKMSLSDFNSDLLYQIVWIFNFTSIIADQVTADRDPIKIEEVLKAYSCKNNVYKVTLDGKSLTGSSLFGEVVLDVKTNETYVTNIDIEKTKILLIISMSASFDVSVSKIDWSFYPSEDTLKSYTTYTV